MSNYVYGSSISYRDYLQTQSLLSDVRTEISSSTALQVASTERLHAYQKETISTMSKEVARVYSEGIERISQGLSELNSTFYWGFSEVVTSLGRVTDTLELLLQVAKTPAQTWAYEQFNIARDAFRRQLYEESLEYLNRAISGHGSNTGYKLDYRCSYLKGAIHLGSFRQQDPPAFNLALAEEAFSNAARYARSDFPLDSARSLIGAGWAAYCQGKMTEALKYTKGALELNAGLSEAHFQAAKVCAHVKEFDHSFQFLERAIDLDYLYSLKVLSDGDFAQNEEGVQAVIRKVNERERKTSTGIFQKARQNLKKASGLSIAGFRLADYARRELARADAELVAAEGLLASLTLCGVMEAREPCSRLQDLLLQAKLTFSSKAMKSSKSELERLRQEHKELTSRQEKSKENSSFLIGALGTLAGAAAGTKACSALVDGGGRLYTDLRRAVKFSGLHDPWSGCRLRFGRPGVNI